MHGRVEAGVPIIGPIRQQVTRRSLRRRPRPHGPWDFYVDEEHFLLTNLLSNTSICSPRRRKSVAARWPFGPMGLVHDEKRCTSPTTQHTAARAKVYYDAVLTAALTQRSRHVLSRLAERDRLHLQRRQALLCLRARQPRHDWPLESQIADNGGCSNDHIETCPSRPRGAAGGLNAHADSGCSSHTIQPDLYWRI